MKHKILGKVAAMAIATMPVAATIADAGAGIIGQRQKTVLVEAAYLSNTATTNFAALTSCMTLQAKFEFQRFCNAMLIEGKQYFMPDYCKFKYVFEGAHDDKGFVFGFYNPFYDAWFVFDVIDEYGLSIEGFKVVDGSYFTSKKSADFPAATGLNPAEEYLAGVYAQVKETAFAMRKSFSIAGFHDQFKAIPDADEALVQKLMEICKSRIGQALLVANDNRVLRDAVICNTIVNRGVTDKFVADDSATTNVLKVLGDNLESMRRGFKIIGYFPSGEESNLLYTHPKYPALLVQANVSENGRVWLKMFEVSSIGMDIK